MKNLGSTVAYINKVGYLIRQGGTMEAITAYGIPYPVSIHAQVLDAAKLKQGMLVIKHEKVRVVRACMPVCMRVVVCVGGAS